MNLFSWLWIVSWIGSCLFTQALLRAAHASPPLPHASVSSQYSSPFVAVLLQAPSTVKSPLVKPPLVRFPVKELTLHSSSSDRAIDSLFSQSALPHSTALSSSFLSSSFASAASAEGVTKITAAFALPELSNSVAQLPFDLLQTHPVTAPNYPANSTVSHRLLQLVNHLSRWTKGISEALRLVPLVTVVQINPPPLKVDHWNVLGLDDLGVPPAEAADFPQPSCLGEATETFPSTLTSLFQVQVRGKPIAEFPTQQQAEQWAERLQQVIQMDNFDPHTLKPVLLDGTPGGKAGEVPLFWVEPELALQLDRSAELLAITWINNLRTALNVPALSLVESQKQMHDLVVTDDRLEGTASWYGPYFHGRLTATGETFDQTELTAAHPSLPFDTYLKVINLETSKAVIVRINDRGPYFEDRSLDLSREAARCLNSEISGVVSYEAIIMKRSSGAFDAASVEEVPTDSPTDATDQIAANDSSQTAASPEEQLQPVDSSSSAETPASSETANP